MTEEIKATFAEWAILELMGHRRLAGHVTEQEIAGASFIRIDVPGVDATVATQFYAPVAIYAITPTTEEVARAVASANQPEPVTRWELTALLTTHTTAGAAARSYGDDDDDEDEGYEPEDPDDPDNDRYDGF
ncbi:MAG: acetyltransferase [Bacillota bacterium]